MLLCSALVACVPGQNCEPDASTTARLCVPNVAALADAPLVFSAEEACGSPCDSFEPTCQVTRDGGELTVALVGNRCTNISTPCVAVCSIRKFRCELGPLPAGTYSVRSGGELQPVLVVNDAGVTQCGLDGG